MASRKALSIEPLGSRFGWGRERTIGRGGERKRGRTMWSGFRAFLLKTNALALAIGVVIGVALGAVVNSLVNDIIMPPIGLLLGGVDFGGESMALKARAGGDRATEVAIRYGAFINAVIAFVVV